MKQIKLKKKQNNKKQNLKKVLLTSVLILLSTSCTTLKQNTKIEIPTIQQPNFPINVADKNIDVTVDDNGTVTIEWLETREKMILPIWVWEDIVEYAIDVDSALSQYKVIIDKLNVQY